MLPFGQYELLAKISKVNPNLVTVVVSGAPNDLNAVIPVSKALVQSWFNGTEGGNALADVLIGTISPSGRLPFTLPIKLEDSPAYALGNFPQGAKSADVFANLVAQTESKDKPQTTTEPAKNDPNRAAYSEESLVGYRYFDTKKVAVAYPFGHGLTYTTFEYSNLKTGKAKYGKDDVISLSMDIKNTGKVAAEEVVQAYVHRINPSVEWPEKELKAFTRVPLNPGEKKTISLEIPVKKLQYWNQQKQAWADDLCNVELQVNASAGDIRLKKQISLK
jgi:beta-glucosidase